MVVVLRNPARGREWLGAFAFLPMTLVILFNPRVPGWLRIAMVVTFLVLFVLRGLAAVSRIVVFPFGVDVRAVNGRRHRLAWSEMDHFAVGGKYRVDVHPVAGRRITVMRFRPVEDESPASMVALLEYQRRRLGGAAVAGGSAASISG